MFQASDWSFNGITLDLPSDLISRAGHRPSSKHHSHRFWNLPWPVQLKYYIHIHELSPGTYKITIDNDKKIISILISRRYTKRMIPGHEIHGQAHADLWISIIENHKEQPGSDGLHNVTHRRAVNRSSHWWEDEQGRVCCTRKIRGPLERMGNHERIFSILSRAMSTPLIRSVTRRGKIVSFVLSATPSTSSDLLSNKAFSRAKGNLSVTLVSFMVNLDRPMTSK